MSVIYDDFAGLKDVERLVFDNEPIALSDSARKRIDGCYRFLERFAKDKVIYGINTGFGPMAQYRVDEDQLKALQYNIIRSHSAGAGEPLDDLLVRSAMIARLGTLAQGYSGIHLSVVELLVEMINRGIYPRVPQHGSVGASGDLVQLAHIALAMIGEGEVHYHGVWRKAGEVLKENGLKPIEMYVREGLCIVNGTSVMTGIGMVNLIESRRLLGWSIVASAMINELVCSYDDCFSVEVNRVKRHQSQQTIGAAVRKVLEGTSLTRNRKAELYDRTTSERQFKQKMQPYYSLRCVPQILGPVLDTVLNTERILVDELNSCCDNPIVDPQSECIYHGGNFHGDYVSLEMDKLKIAVTRLTMLAERQMNYIFHDKINEMLPPFVNLGVLGLNYGLQAAQFTATSTTAECQTLSMPNYVHSIPNNNDNQDIVSMGTNSALIARRVIENSWQVMAIHFMALVQGVDCLKVADRLAPATRHVYDSVRQFLPVFVDDTPKYEQIEQMIGYLKTTNIEEGLL